MAGRIIYIATSVTEVIHMYYPAQFSVSSLSLQNTLISFIIADSFVGTIVSKLIGTLLLSCVASYCFIALYKTNAIK